MGVPPKKIPSFLWPLKDDVGLKAPGVYRVSCNCGQVYVGQIGHSIKTRIKKCQRHIRLEQPGKSAMVKHSINWGHCFKLPDPTIFSTKTRYLAWIIRAAIKIELHVNNMKRVDGLCLSRSWKLLIHTLAERRRHWLYIALAVPSQLLGYLSF
jgi:hypothetical protein